MAKKKTAVKRSPAKKAAAKKPAAKKAAAKPKAKAKTARATARSKKPVAKPTSKKKAVKAAATKTAAKPAKKVAVKPKAGMVKTPKPMVTKGIQIPLKQPNTEQADGGGAPQTLNTPSRATVKPRVCNAVANFAVANGAPAGQVARARNGDETVDLESDLGLAKQDRERLAVDYTNISRSYPTGIDVGLNESGEAKTLSKAITLVHTRANGSNAFIP